MLEEDIKDIIAQSRESSENKISTALSFAKKCFEKEVKYIYGGKTIDGLDCSGLVTFCYPQIFKDGAQEQFDQLEQWLFKKDDLYLVESGDLIFFSREGKNEISHVGIIEARSTLHEALILHASENRGKVCRDEWDPKKDTFRNTYIVKGIAKVRPFIFRKLLELKISEIHLELE